MPPKRLRSSKNREAIKEIRQSFIHKLTPAKIDEYIDTKVTDLPSAKQFLKKMSKLMLYILKVQNLQ